MLIILSPAKSLDFEKIPETLQKLATKQPKTFSSKPVFINLANDLVAEMKKFKATELSQLMSISENLALLNFNRFQNFSLAEEKQAFMAFDGDVYSEIDRKNFSESDFEYTGNHVRILSGLYGILNPFDLIRPYRLEMGTNFKNFNFLVPTLYRFWDDKISEELNKNRDKTIINLASIEYFQAINLKKISAKIINIHFKEKVVSTTKLRACVKITPIEAENFKTGSNETKTTLKTIGINAKKARGLITNFAIREKIQNENDLKSFKEKGYSFDEKLSDQQNWIFVR